MNTECRFEDVKQYQMFWEAGIAYVKRGICTARAVSTGKIFHFTSGTLVRPVSY